MKIVFLSNYFSHHQKALSEELSALSDYRFIATAKMDDERKKLGWKEEKPEYVIDYDEHPEEAEKAVFGADVVIAGSAPEKLIQRCIKNGKTVFRYAERPLKNGNEPLKFIPRFIKWHLLNPADKPVYMLCASAYTAGDYAKYALFENRCFKWGYFPESLEHGDVFEKKKRNSILWAGRLIDWKHPDDALFVAERLFEEGFDFEMNIIGTGELEKSLSDMIKEKGLSERVRLLGAMEPEKVREHMEKASVFLFTSDRKEGWGAVLNEAMDSGCAVTACSAAGSTLFLVKDGENGFVYSQGNREELYRKVRFLIDNPEEAEKAGIKARKTIKESWNAKIAAERFTELAKAALDGKNPGELYQSGPCSPAKTIKEVRQ